MEPTSEQSRAVSPTRTHLDRGFRFEEGGTLARALEIYHEALAAATSPAEQAEARLRIARVYRTMADWTHSREESTEAVRLAQVAGLDDLAAEALNVEVGALQGQGRFDEADNIARRAFDLARSPRVQGITLQNLGRSAAERRDFDTSDRYFDESIKAFRSANYELGLAVALVNASRAALDRGNAARSVEIGREAITIARRLNSLDVLLTAVQNQAAAFVATGMLDSAEGLLTEALGHFTSARNPIRQAECLEIMGHMSELRSDWETAVRCYSRARDLARTADDQPLSARLGQRITAAGEARSARDDRGR
jgi:tetratricopeptide (TPR) repeat protein